MLPVLIREQLPKKFLMQSKSQDLQVDCAEQNNVAESQGKDGRTRLKFCVALSSA
jgi:hypothetical protein